MKRFITLGPGQFLTQPFAQWVKYWPAKHVGSTHAVGRIPFDHKQGSTTAYSLYHTSTAQYN